MRHALAVLAVLAIPAFVQAENTRPKGKPKQDPLAGTTALAPIREGSVTLIPLVRTATAPPRAAVGPLLVLDEAMRKKLVRIHEVDDSGNVNELTLSNKSNDPLFLLAGEVIIGGKQDRIIGRNTIIPAKTTQSVPVFCVEHGRWDGGGGKREFTTANALAHGRLRAKASFADQGEVWNEVATKNRALKTENRTDTYRTIATQKVGAIDASEKRVRAALAKVRKDHGARLVGYAIAINGDVATVDVFGSPSLLEKLEPKLVRSYLTDAADVPLNREAKPPGVTEVKAFVADAEAAEERNAYDTRAASTVNAIGSKAAKASVRYKAAPKAGTPAAGSAPEAAPPAAVYDSYNAQ